MNMYNALPEMLNCMNMTVLERQRARMKWQHNDGHHDQIQMHHQYHQHGFNFGGSELSGVFTIPIQASPSQGLMGFLGGEAAVKPDLSFENGCAKLGFGNISRTLSCPPTVAAEKKSGDTGFSQSQKLNLPARKESFKKRKADKAVAAEDDSIEKRMKGCTEEGASKIREQTCTNNTTNNDRESSGDTSKDNSKASEVQKPDYIHVRARRGQATDSHSLAERVRREKISERMKYLQDLVPGCNKITGKAGMLDEIINYVQSLQRQVEFLSMKLAAVNPKLDFNIEDLFEKEVFPACPANFQMSAEMTNSSAYLQFNQIQQLVSSCGIDLGMNSPDLALRRTISPSVSIPAEPFLDTSCFTQAPPTAIWDADLQSLVNVEFHQGRTPSFQTQPFPGSIGASNLKTEI